ncbi:MAG: hypothetical protein RL385_5067, partial [Pseudomonadota bacterium]
LPVPHDLVLFGEVGLTGELRSVPRASQRIAEAAKLGFKRAVIPARTAERLSDVDRAGVEIVGCSSLADALLAVFSRA